MRWIDGFRGPRAWSFPSYPDELLKIRDLWTAVVADPVKLMKRHEMAENGGFSQIGYIREADRVRP
jgi:hypothetical protein